MDPGDLHEHRRVARAERRRLPADRRQEADAAIRSRIAELVQKKALGRVAAYTPTDGEVDVSPLLASWEAEGTEIYYPDVDGGEILFRRSSGPPTAKGAFGIPRPTGAAVPLMQLDLVLVPLVLFRRDGHRVGRGKGFYDRALAPRADATTPATIGVAYDFQECAEADPNPTDVALDIIVTPTATYTS